MTKFNDTTNGVTSFDEDLANNTRRELRNAIETTGITISDSDFEQIAKSMANYSAVSTYYTDSGAADVYVLDAIDNFKSLTALKDGAEARFRAANPNTGASTINVAGTGVRDIKLPDGASDPAAGDIPVTQDTSIRYDLANDVWVLNNLKIVGDVVQIVNFQTGAVATGTTIIPIDDTIPQNTEGDEYMSLTITPTNDNNELFISISAILSHTSASTTQVGVLFQNNIADALAVGAEGRGNIADALAMVNFGHKMTAGTTNPITFKFRAGSVNAGTTTFNGRSGSRLFGGTASSSITITEIQT